jgi:hypothetical protein
MTILVPCEYTIAVPNHYPDTLKSLHRLHLNKPSDLVVGFLITPIKVGPL